MSVVYLIVVVLLDLSIDACYARSFGVDHVIVRNSEIQLSDQLGKSLKKVEFMKMNLKEEGRTGEEKTKNSEEVKNSSSKLAWTKHLASVSVAVPPKTHSSDHPIFYSDYDSPKPKPPSHN